MSQKYPNLLNYLNQLQKEKIFDFDRFVEGNRFVDKVRQSNDEKTAQKIIMEFDQASFNAKLRDLEFKFANDFDTLIDNAMGKGDYGKVAKYAQVAQLLKQNHLTKVIWLDPDNDEPITYSQLAQKLTQLA